MSKKNIISVNVNEITSFKQEAGKLFFKPEAEDQLIKLIKLKELVDKAIDQVKEQIKESGEKALGVEFRGVIGDKVKVIQRFYGQKYELVDKDLPSDFVDEVVVKKIRTKEVDEYLKNEGRLPEGIKFKERGQSLSIIINDK